MSDPTPHIPKYRLHKGSGQALVQIDGRRTYLGRHGTEESKERYRRIIASWLATGKPPDDGAADRVTPASPVPQSVSELILGYWNFAKSYYRKHGKLTGEADNIRTALRPVLEMYGHTPAREFGAKALVLVRQAMIQAGLARKVINARVSRIKRMFRWAAKEELIPAGIYHCLLAVEGLQRGRSAARETAPVQPVPEAQVQATLPFLTWQVRAMVEVQELAGMRPQDIRNLRTCDLDMLGDVWIYRPWTHKTEHHGHVRQIAIGPRAQAILKSFLKPREPTRYVFDPSETVAAYHARRRSQRRTRRTPSELRRPRQAHPRRKPGSQYSRASYEGAIARACQRAKVPRWSPNQLRHSCATKVRRLYGLDGAAAVLGHRLGTVTEVYAEADLQKAIRIMREIG
jgi:integrase